MPAKKRVQGNGVQGRPSLMTEERIERIVMAIRSNSPRHVAAGFAGVGRSTFQEWLARGHAGEQPYADFLARIQQAEDTASVHSCSLITSSPDWRAHAWYLARKHKEFREPPAQVELSNPDGTLQPIGATLQVTPDTVRLIRELRSAELSARPARQPSTVRTLSE